MAIGRVNLGVGANGLVLESLQAGSAIREGSAIGVVEVLGVLSVYEVSASSNGANFCGFSRSAYSVGDLVRVLSVRGSTLTPIIKSGAQFNKGQRVWLSETLGEVSQTVPNTAGNVILQVGVATSNSDLILLTDFRVG
jgi:hypothetical protein